MSEKAWVAVGDQASWERGLENGIWGLRPELQNHWLKIRTGDLVLFYCTAPVKGYFGAGIIRSRFRQTAPYWEREITKGEVIWPYRFEFDVTHLIPLGSWRSSAVSNKDFRLAILAGINPVADFSKALQILEKLKFTEIRPTVPDEEVALKIFQIGKFQRMIVESNVPVEQSSLDVAWKRTIRSVPTFSFCVNLESGLGTSIQTLKQAYDLWNSRPFLITGENRLAEVQEIVSGLYHEFSSSLKTLTPPQVHNLYSSKKRYYELEERYGLR